jgi:hypothetical protein
MRGKAGLFSRFQPFSPDSLSGLTGWWDASDPGTLFDATSGGSAVSADGGVARLEDKSGNDRHFTQGTGGNRPTRKTTQRNGLDVLRFDGTNNRMAQADLPFIDFVSSTASAAFVVAKAESVATNSDSVFSNACVLSESQAAHGFVMLRSNDTAAAFGYDNSYRTSSLSYVPGSWKVFSTTHDGSSLSFFINGGSPSSTSLGSRQFMGGQGLLGSNASESEFFDGDVGEIITYNVALSTADREAVEAYLMSKWGIS